jgi:hypothetical protein
MKARIRELLQASPFRPFVFRMADGREYRIDHPDFVLASANDASQVLLEETNGRTHFLSPREIASVEPASLEAK